MLAARPFLRSLRTSHALRSFSSKKPVAATPAAKEEDEDAVSPVTEKRQEMTKFDRHMVYGTPGEHMPAPILPADPKEIAALDTADEKFRTMMDGTPRTVVIRQQHSKIRQAPLNPESTWRIYFYEDGMTSEKWDNGLMGWTSNADPYQCAPPLIFENAQEAVYFAKKRGWKYIVQKPILRYMRSDDAQYQDNFLSQGLAAQVHREGTSCDEWKRSSAGTSHYFRPLKYHGDGTVSQHGPNGDEKIAPHVEGCYKMR